MYVVMSYQLLLRFLILLLGLALLAFGVAISIRSQLGTSPISSLPYVYSFVMPLSVGILTICMHIIMIVSQMLLLGQQFHWHRWLQLPIGMIFGFGIDTMLWLTESWVIETYMLQMLFCMVGCIITAIGVCLLIKANLVFLAGEGLYQAVSMRFGIAFGSCKTYGDVILVSLAALSSWLFLHEIVGIREGTIVTALMVGSLVKLLLPYVSFLDALNEK